jgi:SAGA-associated factor 29
MQEIKQTLDGQYNAGEDPSDELEEELMKLSRENIKVCDDVIAAVEGASDHDVDSLLGQLNVLAALRASSEADIVSTPMSRVASSGKPSRNAKRGKDNLSVASAEDRDTTIAESPSIPSPKVSIPATTRLKVTAGASRAGSVPAGREASVKIEDATDTDGTKCTQPPTMKLCRSPC